MHGLYGLMGKALRFPHLLEITNKIVILIILFVEIVLFGAHIIGMR